MSDLNRLKEFAAMVVNKAIDEPYFSSVYAKLCKALYDMTRDKPKHTFEDGKEVEVNLKFKSALLRYCQRTFQNAQQLEAKERERLKKAEKLANDPAQKEKITAMPKEERRKHGLAACEESREAVLTVVISKRHVIGNITFIGQLFLFDLVSSASMECPRRLFILPLFLLLATVVSSRCYPHLRDSMRSLKCREFLPTQPVVGHLSSLCRTYCWCMRSLIVHHSFEYTAGTDNGHGVLHRSSASSLQEGRCRH